MHPFNIFAWRYERKFSTEQFFSELRQNKSKEGLATLLATCKRKCFDVTGENLNVCFVEKLFNIINTKLINEIKVALKFYISVDGIDPRERVEIIKFLYITKGVNTHLKIHHSV